MRPLSEANLPVIEFGGVPPPFGGVTVHVSRLISHLKRDGFFVVHVARSGGGSSEADTYVRWPTLPRYLNHLEFIRGLGSPFGHGVLHVHDNPVFLAPLVAIHLLRRGRAVFTVHDQMLPERLSRGLAHERFAFRLVTRSRYVRWIAVSQRVRDILQRRGVEDERIRVVPAYLPANESNELEDVPADLARFLRAHYPTMVVYGYRRVFLDGRDTYGFDFAVRVLSELVREEPNAGLLILCPDASLADESWRGLVRDVQSRGLAGNIRFLLKPVVNISALWRRCTIMLRPTITDGDSVAVREMLALGLPVIASNAAPRPDQAAVLSLESPKDWADAVSAIAVLGGANSGADEPLSGSYEAVRDVLTAAAASWN